jgi:Ca-activated chloride channel family protein
MDVGLLLWWWMLPLLLLVGGAVGVLAVVRRRRADRGKPVAHMDRLTALPRYRRAFARYRAWTALGLVLLILTGVGTAFVAARPAAVNANQNDDYKRDILLCLDVSGSMVDVDADILGVFQDIAAGLDGERIGMRIFDASSVMAFPLTSDYDYIVDQLGRYQRAFLGTLGPDEQFSYAAGTSNGNGASLVGDGLASCALDFADTDDTDRPRSIILATDNMVNGQQIFSLEQAGQLAIDNDVRVYAINPFDWGGDPVSSQLQTVAETTGGAYFALDFADTVSSIVDRIGAIEAGYIETPPEVQIVDRPGPLLPLLMVLIIGICVVAWRVRL